MNDIVKRIEIQNWILEKAIDVNVDTELYLPVRMIANRLDLDKENQEILPQAFNKATVSNFLKNGIIDWHHESKTGKTSEVRANAILGSPTDFKWELHQGRQVPVIYANLTKAHNIVKNSIAPHLEAKQKVFAASVGGDIKKARRVISGDKNSPKDQIIEIDWDHLAIAASSYVISPGSEVSLVKAYSVDTNNDSSNLKFTFRDISSFERDADLVFNGEEIRKALTVGAGTDITSYTGVDALRGQSLEGDKSDKYSQLIQQVAMGLRDNTIGASTTGIKTFLKAMGLDIKQSTSFMKQFIKVMTRVLKN